MFYVRMKNKWLLMLFFKIKTGVEIISYLPLQMSLYFNVCYSPFWILALIVGLEAKVSRYMLRSEKLVLILVFSFLSWRHSTNT